MTELEDSRIRKLVLDTLTSRFQDIEIVDVKLESDEFIDGDRVLRISVVFNGRSNSIDGRATAGVLRNLIPKMGSLEEIGFPLLSFISQSDFNGRSKVAPA